MKSMSKEEIFRRFHMSVIGFHLLCASIFMILVGLYLDKEDMN